MKWYFPETMDELLKLLAGGLKIHGGGTMLLRLMRGAGADIRGLVSLSKLPLDGARLRGDEIEIGAANTFSGAVRKIDKLLGGGGSGRGKFSCLLCAAMGSAASTPIRNRVTVGGSVASLPPWSDLMAPLSVLGAKVVLAGPGAEKDGVEYDFGDFYANSRKLTEKSVITALRVPALGRRFAYHRETRTAFDYPAFTVAVSALFDGETARDVRIAVSGVTERVVRLSELENYVTGQDAGAMKTPGLARLTKDVRLNFGNKPAGSAEYLAHAARVEVERGLSAIAREVSGE